MTGLSSREEKILGILAKEGDISVAALSESLGVSQVTIRNDLKNLDTKGYVVRTRGSALVACHPLMSEKQNSNTQEKERIAEKAGELVEDGDSVLICNGTTSALVARHFLGKKDINVVTNNTLILPYARVNSGMNVTLVGGEFRPQTEGNVGPVAVRQIQDYHAKWAFLGTDGFTIEHGLTTALAENAEIVRAMCREADITVLTVDSSKFGKKGFVKILEVKDIDMIITGKEAPDDILKEAEELGVKVIKV